MATKTSTRSDDIPQRFAVWLTTQTNANGTLFLKHVAKRYVDSMLSAPLKLNLPLPMNERDLFACRTIVDLDRLRDIFRSAPNYKEVNHNSGHGAFSAGLGAYRRYLESLVGQNNTINTEFVPDSIIAVLAADYPNGFTFDTTAVRLLSEKSCVEVDMGIQTALKRLMFRRNDNIYFLLDVVADAKTRKDIIDFADMLLDDHVCFEVSELYALFINSLNKKCVDSLENFEAFYNFISKRDVRYATHYGTRIARVQNKGIHDLSADIAQEIISITCNEFGGVISEDDLRKHFSGFSAGLLANIIEEHAEELIKTRINGIVCYQSIDVLGLSDDFCATLAETLSEIDNLGLLPSEEVLHTALSLKMSLNFKVEYNIPDDKTFRRLIVAYYKEMPRREWNRGVFVEVQD